MILAPFEDEMMKILSVAAVVSLICGYIQHGFPGLVEGFSIIISIVIILFVTAYNDYKQE
jgi:magnesium-transporting ATPase (P-type)